MSINKASYTCRTRNILIFNTYHTKRFKMFKSLNLKHKRLEPSLIIFDILTVYMTYKWQVYCILQSTPICHAYFSRVLGFAILNSLSDIPVTERTCNMWILIRSDREWCLWFNCSWPSIVQCHFHELYFEYNICFVSLFAIYCRQH